MSLNKIKNALIDLYLGFKIRKREDLYNLTDNIIEEEKNKLNKLPILELINYISNSFEILLELKAKEKYEEKLIEDAKKDNFFNYENFEDSKGFKLYEGMLIKAESNNRNYIGVRNILINCISSLIYIVYTRIKTPNIRFRK